MISTGQAMDVNGISTADGANIQTWSYWGGSCQQFRFQSAGTGVWRIIARHSDKCVDVEGASSSDGANVIQWTCISGAANQMFQLNSVSNANQVTQGSGQSLYVYPNPATSGQFTIDPSFMKVNDKIDVEIYSYEGKQVYSNSYFDRTTD